MSDSSPNNASRSRLAPTLALASSALLIWACASLGPTATPTPAPPTLTDTARPPTASQTPIPPTATLAPPTATPTASQTATQAPTETAPAPGEFNPGDYALKLIASGFHRPVLVTHAGDGSGRLFVVEQPGTIRILQDGKVAAEPFLDISARIDDSGNEQGLLGLAFHPGFAANGRFYVDYTDPNGHDVVARFTVSGDPATAMTADPDSEQIVLQVDDPYPNHNGGHLAFGPDGYLYVGLGDGGSAGDPGNRAQNLAVLLGKLLRLDVDSAEPYAIPPDNPFRGQAGAAPEIWAYGLRNPWRYSFDRASGDLYIGDVGQNEWEEIDYQPANSHGGENYGWRTLEGTHPYADTPAPDAVMPVLEYAHNQGGCSVTGGYVYRGQALPALNGVYFFADYCTGTIWSLIRDAAGAWQSAVFLRNDFTISSFGEDQAGELYVLNHSGGKVYQLVRD